MSSEYTYNVEFSGFVPLFEGLKGVWIGDGTTPAGQTYVDDQGVTRYKGGTAGCLYGKYIDGTVQQLGFVSDYAAIKKYMEEHGTMSFTYEEWVELLASVSDCAAEASAAAQSCTDQINAKLDIMNEATTRANTATSNANTATSNANAATTRANNVSYKMENIEANATTLTPWSDATAEVKTENNHFVLDLGIPKGDTDYLSTRVEDETLYFTWMSTKPAFSSKTIYYDFDNGVDTIYDKLQPITNAEIDSIFT